MVREGDIGEEFLYIVRVGLLDEVASFIKENPKLDLNYRNEYGNTAAHYAAANNKGDILAYLIDSGVEYNTKNTSGNTPLQWAVQTDSLNSVQIILSKITENGKKIDLLLPNNYGKSVIGDAFERGNSEILQLILSHPCAEQLEFEKNESEDLMKIIQEYNVEFRIRGISVIIREIALNATLDYDVSIIPDLSKPDFTGVIIWESAICLSNWIVDLSGQFNDKVILELGSGCGLPGIVSGIFNTSKVILSDFSPISIDNLQHNIQLNSNIIKSQIQVLKFDWNESTSLDSGTIDIIIASDIIYDRAQPLNVVRAITRLLKPGGRFLYTFSQARSGIDDFLSLFTGFKLELNEIPEAYRRIEITNLSLDCIQMKFPCIETSDLKMLNAIKL